jgi:hypothetical protein
MLLQKGRQHPQGGIVDSKQLFGSRVSGLTTIPGAKHKDLCSFARTNFATPTFQE